MMKTVELFTWGMPSSEAEREIVFDDPRLVMGVAGRLIVRVAGYLGYLFLIALGGTLLISETPQFRAIGALLALFLLDRLMHLGEGDVPIDELPPRGTVNAAASTQRETYGILEHAYDRSVIRRTSPFLEILLVLAARSDIEEGLRRMDIEPAEFRNKAEELVKTARPPGEISSREFRKDVRQSVSLLAARAFTHAEQAGHRFVAPSDLFAALAASEDESVSRLFHAFTVDPQDLERALIFSHARGTLGGFRRLPRVLGGFIPETHRRIRHRTLNRAWTSRPTHHLDSVGTDLTDLARAGEGGFLIGHKAEYERLVNTLSRPVNPNALLVGEAGIGKETLVMHLAFMIEKDEVPEALFDKRLVALHIANLVAGISPQELDQRLQTIVREIEMAGNVILYIPDIHHLVNTSGTAYLSAADALMPVIMNNAFPLIGGSYPKEFKKYIAPRSDFAGMFEVINVNEIATGEAEEILVYESMILERQTNIVISFAAIKKSVALAKHYFRTKFLPASAEELLKGALIEAKRRSEKTLTADRVIQVAETKTNIPIHEADAGEAQKLLRLEETIHERVIGQDEAVKAVADALREYRSGLARGTGPIASFLFVGPTGVGKTELAKTLARVQFGSEGAMLRFDMTEYQDKKSFFRLIGNPDGSTSGTLTDAVMEKPYCLVLLDEFEKAFPDILDLFLQVLDDGRLTDSLGRTVDFSNTIVIATSNAHSDIVNDALSKGESMADISDYLKHRLTDVFKPELLNRFSRVVVFKNLEPDDLKQVIRVQLQEFAEGLHEKGIYLSPDESAIKALLKLGYDPAFGARPLRRAIEEHLRAPLAQAILKGEIENGAKLTIMYDGTDFRFTPTAPNA